MIQLDTLKSTYLQVEQPFFLGMNTTLMVIRYLLIFKISPIICKTIHYCKILTLISLNSLLRTGSLDQITWKMYMFCQLLKGSSKICQKSNDKMCMWDKGGSLVKLGKGFLVKSPPVLKMNLYILRGVHSTKKELLTRSNYKVMSLSKTLRRLRN